MEHSVKQKYSQMIRVYHRLAQMSTNTGDRISNAEAKDTAEEFFNQCYHLKDYFKKDKTISLSKDVEEYINSNPHLSLAADYCNTFKHGGLDRASRLGKKIEQINVHLFLFQPTQTGINNFTKLEIKIDGQSYEVFAIATECIKAWNEFLKSENLGDIITQ